MVIRKLILYKYKRLSLNSIEYLEYTPSQKIQLILGRNGSGKGQPLTAPIKVPGGWSTMGDMRVGTEVIAKDGSTTTVTGVHPLGLRDIYRISFADGRTTRVTLDHLWKIYVGGKKYPIEPYIATTADIMQLLKTHISNLIWIDLCNSEQNTDQDLPIDPYVLGVILGDGSIKNSVVITHPDMAIMNKVANNINSDLCISIRKYAKNDKCLTYGITNAYGRLGRNANSLLVHLKRYGLNNKNSYEKFVPIDYLNGSTRQRLALLQGLMDTDGTIGKTGTASFCSTSKQLAKDVKYLVQSLGGIAKVSVRYPWYTYQGEKKQGRVAYQVNIRYKKPEELFTLPKKQVRANNDNQYAASLKLRITHIHHVGTEEAQCISIAHPEQLYITNDFIVTHNSSILAQLSPLPGQHSDYHKDGYKHIHIEYNGSQYVLESEFSPSGNRYNFIKDEVELNKGGTVSVYKDLVYQEFGITQEIYDLISGHTSFHDMAPAQRRRWFTLLSDSDYTYAFKYYAKLKDMLKELQAVYKLNQSKLVQERERLLSQEQEHQCRQDIAELKAFIHQLIELKQPILESQREEEQSIRLTLEKNTQQVTALLPQLTLRNTDVSVIDKQIIEHKALEQTAQAQTVHLFNVIQTLEDTIKVLEHTALQSYETLDEQLTALSSQIHHLQKQRRIGLTFSCPATAYNALSSLQEQLTHLFRELPDNSDGSYSLTVYEALEKDYQQNQLKLDGLNRKIYALLKQKTDLEHAREHHQLTCPKCSYVWHKGYTEETYYEVTQALETLHSDVAACEAEGVTLKGSLEARRARLSNVKQFRLLCHHWSVLEPLWASMAEYDVVSIKPGRAIQHIADALMDLQLDNQVEGLKKQQEELITLKRLTDSHQQTDVATVKQEIDKHQHTLQALSTQIKDAKAQVQQLEQQKKLILQLRELEQTVQETLKERTRLGKLKQLKLKQVALNDTLRALQLALTEKEQLIAKIDVQKGIIEHLEATLVEYESKQALLKIAIKELSPSEGLIAKGLTSFINHFVNHINAFIKQVWEYPLAIIPILPESNDEIDLDYRFKVLINDSNEISDIMKGSSAMRAVINLAFQLVSMAFLKMETYPVIADELGASFDKEHRKNLLKVINELLINSQYSQLFMVSHYEEMHGSLAHADINVLEPSLLALSANPCLILK